METTWGAPRGKEGARSRAHVHAETFLLIFQCVGVCPAALVEPSLRGQVSTVFKLCPALVCGSLMTCVPGMHKKSAKAIQRGQVLRSETGYS